MSSESHALKIAAYTGGIDIPSARLRVRQYVAPLRGLGIRITEHVSRAGAYPPDSRFLRPAWGICSLSLRVAQIARSYRQDLTLLQREILSTFVTLEPLARRPRILDVDDAIWVHRGGGFARRLARLCDGVICGNDFLAGWFSRYNSSIAILPTAVDTDRLRPAGSTRPHGPVIGWCGSRSNLKYLRDLQPPLGTILKRHPDVKLRIVCDAPPLLDRLPPEKLEVVPWTAAAETAAIQSMTVGLMPLRDDLWCRGKCSYKMLTYMACGVPVVVSPVGMNQQVLRQGACGFEARTHADWVDALEAVLSNPSLAAGMGRLGRSIVLQNYSLQILAPRFAGLLRHFAGVVPAGEAGRYCASA